MKPEILKLLQQRYFRAGEETWEDIVYRVLAFLYPECMDIPYEPWAQHEKVLEALLKKEFIPSSPILMNAGAPVPMLHSCFVLPVQDDLELIMASLSDTAMIQKYGGGVGINFSSIRPEGSPVRGTGGIASGPVSFMRLWNACMDVVKQAGKRQGALMGVLNILHSDIDKFLAAKKEEGILTNFNLSVGIDKLGYVKHDKINEIAKCIHYNGEPGILFLDNIDKSNPYPVPINCCNPCGEIPIPPYGACCLGSINLNACLNSDYTFNWPKFESLVQVGIRFLERVNLASDYVLPEVAEFMEEYSPLGLGLMGLADVLAKMGYVYGNESSLLFVEGLVASAGLTAHLEAERPHATYLSMAPTGTIAMIAGCSYSIEPFFKLAYKKHVDAGDFIVFEPTVDVVLEQHGLKLTDEERLYVYGSGSFRDLDRIPEEVKLLLRTANEIPWIEHLRMQAAIQRHVDNAVSKTINLPFETTWQEIRDIIYTAHELGLKGLTMYRSGSRQYEVIQACPTGTCDL